MKQVKVKVTISDPRVNVKVGDRIEFKIGSNTFQDTITHVDSNCIEGEEFNLTNVKFRIISHETK